MQAAILKEPDSIFNNPLQLGEIPIREITANEILIKNQACAICHTDLHIIEGEIKPHKLPIIPGHQIIGIVEKVGENVKRFKVGDKLGVAWLNSTCNNCSYCKQHLENLCPQAKFTGYDIDGGYCEWTIINEEFAYNIPEYLSSYEASPLLCAGIIGYRALKLSNIKPEGNLAIFGFGASAHVVIQIANYWRCAVYVFTRSKQHQELAKELGAVWVGNSSDTPKEKMHSAIIFAPAGELVINALRVLDRGGTLSLAGIYMTDIPPIDYNELLYYEKKITSVCAATRSDAEELLQLAVKIPIKTKIQLFELNEVNKALQLLKMRKINGAGVIKIK